MISDTGVKIKKKWPPLLEIILLASVISVFVLGLSITLFDLPAAFGEEKKLPVYSVGTDEKKVAISFDAAWGNDHTRPILDILDRYGVKTTFFLVKFWAEKYPDDVREIAARGHEVQNHSATHPDMTKLSREQMTEELKSTEATIERLTGVKPDLFRPPFGAYNNAVIETSEDAGYKVIQWSVDSLDWKELPAQDIIKRVISRVEPGSIVLFHNHALYVEDYLPPIIEALQKEGYQIVPVGELIYRNDYHMDNTGKQILN